MTSTPSHFPRQLPRCVWPISTKPRGDSDALIFQTPTELANMIMMIFSLCIFCFLLLLLTYGVIEIEGSHHVCSNLQTLQLTSIHHQAKEPYRTGFHFQPPKNWINGMCISSASLIFFRSGFDLICSFYSFPCPCLCLLLFITLTVCSMLLSHLICSNCGNGQMGSLESHRS